MPPMNAAPTVALTRGVQMPLLGFGTWQMRGRSAHEAVRYALDVGYRHIDTAYMYGNEAEIGRAVHDSGLDRRDLFVTTKLPPENAGRERQTIAASLRSLNMPYVDLWLVHWPPGRQALVDTWRQFLAIRDEGHARSVGVSNYSTPQIDELIAATGEAPSVNQIRWGPSLYDPRRLAEHRDRGVVLEGYSPFKSTNLRDPVLLEIAKAYGVPTSQVVIRWHLQHETPVIPKSRTPERIASNFDVFGFTLTAEDMARIDHLSPYAR